MTESDRVRFQISLLALAGYGRRGVVWRRLRALEARLRRSGPAACPCPKIAESHTEEQAKFAGLPASGGKSD
jgi:hypothetical protein